MTLSRSIWGRQTLKPPGVLYGLPASGRDFSDMSTLDTVLRLLGKGWAVRVATLKVL
jgi:hypothetical protein